MVATYCTGKQVMSRLQLLNDDANARYTFSEEDITQAEMDEWINETEEEIEKYTRRAWRTLTKTDEPYNNNDFVRLPRRLFSYARPVIYVKLKQAHISSITKLEMFDGTSFIDMVAGYTEGEAIGDGDWSINLKTGEIFITTNVGIIGRDYIRITYDYGEAGNVPKDVQRACIMLTCIVLLESDDFTRRFTSADGQFSLPSKAQVYERQAYRILKRHRRYNSLKI